MANEIQVKTGQDLISFDQSKLDLIRKELYPKLSQSNFDIFISAARARGLDPVLNQIHAVVRRVKVSSDPDKYEDRMTIQVGIDGFRLIAARTSEYAGCDETVFKFDSNNKPIDAKVTVYRIVQGMRVSFTASAYWDEFYPGDKQGFMWKSKPRTMLGKCAEAQALRKAFPNDLGNLYVPEEVEQIEPKDVTPQKFSDDDKTKRVSALLTNFKKLGISESQIRDKIGMGNEVDISAMLDDDIKVLNNLGSRIVKEKLPANETFEALQVESFEETPQ